MYQYYVVEVQQYQDGTFGHIVHFAYDENNAIAKRKAEAKYHEILAAAAVSELPMHSAILFGQDGYPYLHQSYEQEVTNADTEV